MAVSESDFKSGFKRDLMAHYPDALIWTNSDMFRAGLPDMSALQFGVFYAIELKFVSKLPKKKSSKCLKHEVTGAQLTFMEHVRRTNHRAVVVIGLNDVAVVMTNIKENYTLEELLQAPRITRTAGHWDVAGFFERLDYVG